MKLEMRIYRAVGPEEPIQSYELVQTEGVTVTCLGDLYLIVDSGGFIKEVMPDGSMEICKYENGLYYIINVTQEQYVELNENTVCEEI